MSKAADMAKVSARGGFHLAWGLAASTVITSIGVIILARILSPSDFGLYTIALTVPNLVQLFRDWGTSFAIVKYGAFYSSKDDQLKVKQIVVSGLVFQVALSVILTVASFVLSGFFAASVFGRPDIVVLIQVISLSLLGGAFISLVQTKTGTPTSAAQAAFIGLEKTELNSLALLTLSVIRTVLTTFLVVFGFGAFGASAGYSLSLLFAGVVCLLLFFLIYRDLPKGSWGELRVFENLKEMIRYGFPLSVVSIVHGFTLQFYLIILAVFVSDALIGNYSVATNFVVLITFLAIPIMTMLYPAFSKLDAKKDRKDLGSVFRFSIKYGALIVVPVTFLIISLCEPVVFTVFGSQYSSAPLFLALLALPYLLSAFGFLSVTNFLNGQGHTILNLKVILLNSFIGLSLGYLLISFFEVAGLIFAIFVAEIPGLIIRLYWIWRNYGFTVDWISSVKILVSSAVSGGLAFVVVSYLDFASWINLIFGVIVFVPLWLLVSLLIRVVDRVDIENLRDMTKSLGPFHKIIVLLLGFYERLMVTLKLD